MILRNNRIIFLVLGIVVLFVIGYGIYSSLEFAKKDIPEKKAIFITKDSSVKKIILITIDTLRTDHLSCYGYIQNTSPFLDEIAKQGILFKNAFAAIATTVPSHTSLFTSLYPLQHKVLKNGHKLDDSFLTMAEMFHQMGYKTAGIVSTVGHFKAGNLNQGFDYFYKPEEELALNGDVYQQAEKTINVAIKWLDTVKADEKFLLWIHLYDPHTPLKPHPDDYERLANALNPRQHIAFLSEKQKVNLDFFYNSQEEMLHKIRLYDAEIHYTDNEIKRFYNYYQTKVKKENSLWVITADHGEGLGNHNWWGHGKHIYNEQLRIPLIFHFSSGGGGKEKAIDQIVENVNSGKVVEQLVENVDILPTILDLMNVSAKFSYTIQGKSLLHLMLPQKDRIEHKTYAFSERRVFSTKKNPKKINPKKTRFEAGNKYALQSKEYKYIYWTEGPDEFFDLRVDPYEINNLINSGSQQERDLRATLLKKINESQQDAGTEQPLTVDKKAIKQLKSLGYVQ